MAVPGLYLLYVSFCDVFAPHHHPRSVLSSGGKTHVSKVLLVLVGALEKLLAAALGGQALVDLQASAAVQALQEVGLQAQAKIVKEMDL